MSPQLSILNIISQLDNIPFCILDSFLLNITCFLPLMIYWRTMRPSSRNVRFLIPATRSIKSSLGIILAFAASTRFRIPGWNVWSCLSANCGKRSKHRNSKSMPRKPSQRNWFGSSSFGQDLGSGFWRVSMISSQRDRMEKTRDRTRSPFPERESLIVFSLVIAKRNL